MCTIYKPNENFRKKSNSIQIWEQKANQIDSDVKKQNQKKKNKQKKGKETKKKENKQKNNMTKQILVTHDFSSFKWRLAISSSLFFLRQCHIFSFPINQLI